MEYMLKYLREGHTQKWIVHHSRYDSYIQRGSIKFYIIPRQVVYFAIDATLRDKSTSCRPSGFIAAKYTNV